MYCKFCILEKDDVGLDHSHDALKLLDTQE